MTCDAQGERADGAGCGAPAHGARAQQDRHRARQDQPSLERRDYLSCECFCRQVSKEYMESTLAEIEMNWKVWRYYETAAKSSFLLLLESACACANRTQTDNGPPRGLQRDVIYLG
jgi:hypothetical protein